MSPHRRPVRARLRVLRQTIRIGAAVALGAGIGGLPRLLVAYATYKAMGGGFPWGTLVVNVAGSFVIGFYALGRGIARWAAPRTWRPLDRC